MTAAVRPTSTEAHVLLIATRAVDQLADLVVQQRERGEATVANHLDLLADELAAVTLRAVRTWPG